MFVVLKRASKIFQSITGVGVFTLDRFALIVNLRLIFAKIFGSTTALEFTSTELCMIPKKVIVHVAASMKASLKGIFTLTTTMKLEKLGACFVHSAIQASDIFKIQLNAWNLVLNT